LEATLSPDEMARAKRYRFGTDRRHFVVRRGLQRQILAQYFDCRPAELRFKYNPNGRPSVVAPDTARDFHFNISHSAGLAQLACGNSPLIGVDIEQLRTIEDADAIVARFCSDQERAQWQDIAAEDRELAFFDLWTRKEAVIKALGLGLSMELNRFTVSLNPDDPRLLNWTEHEHQKNRWDLYAIRPAPGFRASLAIGSEPESAEYQIQLFEH